MREWIPALRRMPDQFVYEPWKAPVEVQRAAGCVVGEDYPHPICDLDAAAKANLLKMDACYRGAPNAWKALIPPAAAAEVAKERKLDLRTTGLRIAAFAVIEVSRAPAKLRDAAPSPAAPDDTPPPAVPGCGLERQHDVHRAQDQLSHGRGANRARGLGVSRGRGRGQVSRLQHGLY